jgi:hypothetical protein
VDQHGPDACALVGAAPAPEDVGHLLMGNADTGVAYGQLGVLGPAKSRQLDGAGCELPPGPLNDPVGVEQHHVAHV